MICLTVAGLLGDSFYAIPVASWLWKQTGKKIHWVLASGFPPLIRSVSMFEHLPMTGAVSLVPFTPSRYDCGAQPYHFNPSDYGVTGFSKCYNMGMRHGPDKYISAFMAEEYGLGWDSDFFIPTPDVVKTDEILGTEHPCVRHFAPQSTIIPMPSEIWESALRMKGAKELHLFHSSLATLMKMCRIPFTLYRSYPVHTNGQNVYWQNMDGIKVVEVPAGWDSELKLPQYHKQDGIQVAD